MKRIKIALLAVFGVGLIGLSAPLPVNAINVFKNCTDGSALCEETKDGQKATTSIAQNIVSTLLFVLGIISVIMIIVGGIRYATSNGDASQLTSAKNTILYAVVGLVVAMMAYAIVYFVIGRF